jgi:hypothetical protein
LIIGAPTGFGSFRPVGVGLDHPPLGSALSSPLQAATLDHVPPAFQNSQDNLIPRPIAPVAAGTVCFPGARARRDVQSNPVSPIDQKGVRAGCFRWTALHKRAGGRGWTQN